MTPLESPIEWKFAAAVRDLNEPLLERYTQSSTLEKILKEFDRETNFYLYVCGPQVQCVPHRVDFLFIGFCHDLKPTLVAVECDGHDFHERNKEQVAIDKSRDRELASMGIQVMHFTGSEILWHAGSPSSRAPSSRQRCRTLRPKRSEWCCGRIDGGNEGPKG